jgi:DNA mismatch endonuclease, patch repair protein
MADNVPVPVRSRMMSGIRGKDTRPELLIRRGLFSQGFRYRLHASNLPGKPDMVLARHHAVVLINGCFWHGHDCHLFRWPGSRPDFWKQKITRNRNRDIEVRDLLAAAGWRMLVVWECALKGRGKRPLDSVLRQAAEWLRKKKSSRSLEIKGLSHACR